jgi:hypothetical protein
MFVEGRKDPINGAYIYAAGTNRLIAKTTLLNSLKLPSISEYGIKSFQNLITILSKLCFETINTSPKEK